MSFLEDIEKLVNPDFALPDLEDEDVDGTASSAVFRSKHVGDNDVMKPRRKVIDLSEDYNSKYGGTKVSRDDIFDNSDLVGFADCSALGEKDSNKGCVDEGARGKALNQTTDERSRKKIIKAYNGEEVNDSEQGDCMSDENEEFVNDQSGSDSGVAQSNSDLDSSDNEIEVKDYQRKAKRKSMDTNTFMSSVDKDKQQRKALSVYEQIRIWEHLLYLKIKVHAALRAFNQLPRGQLAKDLMKESNEDTVNSLMRAQKNAVKLASVLMEAEHLLLLSSSFTKSIVGMKGTADSDDDEIESSDDGSEHFPSDFIDEDDETMEKEEQVVEEKSVASIPQAPHLTLKSLCRSLHENEQQFTKFRDTTLLKWEERTKFVVSSRPKNANSDFSAFEKSNIVSQIEKICADKDRLMKRSRTKKSDVERIGGDVKAEEDEEIYDDDDFYQTLLKELIDKKTSKTRDPVAMTRHYIEMQKLRSKRATKKAVDHRASKDRKIKYLPIPKLVNFHPAMPEMVEWNNESRNELFKSLFS